MEQFKSEFLSVVTGHRLFAGLNGEELVSALALMDASYEDAKRGDPLHTMGRKLEKFGLVLFGAVLVSTDDIEGNRMILNQVTSGGTFGESLCFLGVEDPGIRITASGDAGILWLSPAGLFGSIEPLALKLAKRFTAMLAERTLRMNRRIQILSKLSIREKLIAYFTALSADAGGNLFQVPMNREEMADYMGTNRSALSRELSRMKEEGILDFYRNTFRFRKL